MAVLDKNFGAGWRKKLFRRLSLDVSKKAYESISRTNRKAKYNLEQKQSVKYKKKRRGYKMKRSNKAKKVHVTGSGVQGIYQSNSQRLYK